MTALLLLGTAAAWAQAQDPPQIAPASEEPDSAEPESSAEPEAVEPPAGVEEIVIVGEIRTAPSLKDTESVVLFDAEDIQALGAADISDLSAYTPNVEIPTAGSTVATYFIRGIGLADYNANSTSAVSIYRDGVSINSAPIQLGLLYDVEQVQVLRGPQGIGPYRNASAGSINLVSKKPTGDYSAALTSTFGRFDERDFQGHVEAPIVDDVLSGRLAFRFRERDGYMKNGCGHEPDGGRKIKTTDNARLRRDFAVCGERMDNAWVRIGEVSRLPFGLEPRLNDTGTWAARGQLLFTPELDFLDSQQWLLNLHGSHVDELAIAGVSYGTSGNALGSRNRGGYLEGEVEALSNRIEANIKAQILEKDPTLKPQQVQRLTTPLLQVALAKHLATHLDPDPYRIDTNRTGTVLLDSAGGFFEGKFAKGELQLLTRTGYEWYERSVDQDQDYSPIVLAETVASDEAFQVTQDVNLAGGLLDGALTWNLGGFLLYEELELAKDDFIVEGTNPGLRRTSREKTTSLAAYGDLNWRLSDDWIIEGGARFNQESKDYDFLLFTNSTSTEADEHRAAKPVFRAPTGMLSLTYRFSDRSSLYWKYTRGWKAHHMNGYVNLKRSQAECFCARPEQIDSFESGAKLAFFDDSLHIDAALFFYKYKDYQILVVDPSGNQVELVYINADGAKVLGAEFSVDAYPLKDWIPDPLDNLHLNVSFGWLNGRFTEFADSFVRVSGDPQGATVNILTVKDYTGNRLPYSPPFSAAISVDWPFELGRFGTLTPRYDGSWSDEVFFDQTNSTGFGDVNTGKPFLPKYGTGQRPFWLHNFRLSYQTPDGQFELAGWVRNLLDETYKINGFDVSGNFDSVIYLLGEPRTYGVDFTARW